MEDIRLNGGVLKDAIQHITPEAVKVSGLFEPYSIILATTATIGEHAMLIADSLANQQFTNFKIRKSLTYKYNPYYLYYYFFKIDKWCLKNTNAGGLLSVDIPSLKRQKLYSPSVEEQNKIAKLLRLIDDRISIQSRIIEKYETLIKAILVEHYRKCNKTEQFIHDIGEPFNVMNLSKDDLSKDGNPCIIYGELFTTYGCVIENVVSHTTKSPNSTLSTKGDLLFPASTTVDALSLIAPSAINEDGIILGGDMFGIHVNERNNSNYLSYYFNIIGKKNLAKYAKGSTIIHLHYADIQNVKITLPNKNEQEAIAKLLLNVEHKLNIEQKVLANHLNTKNFLLQQMFI